MSTSLAPIFRVCHFEDPFFPVQTYYCYKDEICCKEGCCSRYTEYKYFNSWHFWYKIYIVLGIIAFICLYRYICWYCSKTEQRENVLRLSDEESVNSHLVNLMVSYNSRRNDEAPKDDDDTIDRPPLYNVAIHLPKPPNNDEVPSYEQATLMH